MPPDQPVREHLCATPQRLGSARRMEEELPAWVLKAAWCLGRAQPCHTVEHQQRLCMWSDRRNPGAHRPKGVHAGFRFVPCMSATSSA